VIASHYAEAVRRTVATKSALRDVPSAEGEIRCELDEGAPFLMLDDSLGWAWGYGGEDGRVGYVPSGALQT
jgi:hypothetical protein